MNSNNRSKINIGILYTKINVKKSKTIYILNQSTNGTAPIIIESFGTGSSQIRLVKVLMEVLNNTVSIEGDKLQVNQIEEFTGPSGATVNNTLKVNTIAQRTTDLGVTIDSLLIKNNHFTIPTAYAYHTTSQTISVSTNIL